MMKKVVSYILTAFLMFNTANAFEVGDLELKAICDAFEAIGLSCGTATSDSKDFDYKVTRDGRGLIRLKGVYEDYDQYLSAYMIAQAIAGVSRVSPAFNSFDTNIKIRKSEICLTSLMTNGSSIGNYKCDTAFLPQKSSPTTKGPDKVALIISVGKFKNLKNADLGQAPLNDAKLVESTLKQRGYKVEMLKDEEATKENVLKKIDEIISILPKNGKLFIYASSHGSPKSPNGETGIVLYDTSIENSKKCTTLDNAISNQKYSRDIAIVNTLQDAKKMCNVLSNSLVITEDVIPRLNSSGKNIKLILSFDVCYSGKVFKGEIEKAKGDDVYSIDDNVARYLTFMYPNEMIYISSSSGNQLSLQREFSDKKSYGIFTYHYFNAIPNNAFDLKQSYLKIVEEVKRDSGTTCRAVRSTNPHERCDTNGQTPLFLNNLKVKDYSL